MLYEIKDISKSFGQGNVVIDHFSLPVNKGDMTALYSEVGGGKTTLCHMLTGLTKINGGYIRAGKRIVAKKGSAAGLHKLRQRAIGFVAAEPVYMQDMTIYENFLLTDRGKGSNKAKQTNAREILKMVGLKGMGRYYPKEMTSIEKLKASVARAILNNPVMLVCDDPSEDLLYKNYDNDIEEFMNLLEMLNRDLGITILIATSNPAICKRCKKTVAIHKGVDVREFNRHSRKAHKKPNEETSEADIDNFVVDLGFMDEEIAKTESAATAGDASSDQAAITPSIEKPVTGAVNAAAGNTAKPLTGVANAATGSTAKPVNASALKAAKPVVGAVKEPAQTTANLRAEAAKTVTPAKSVNSSKQVKVQKTEEPQRMTGEHAEAVLKQAQAKQSGAPSQKTSVKNSAEMLKKKEQQKSQIFQNEAAEKAALEAMAAVRAATSQSDDEDEQLPEIDLSDLF
jgi:ABC-type lipoprotein export system ATPase subunit